MNRRDFLQFLSLSSGAMLSGSGLVLPASVRAYSLAAQELRADVVIAGGGLGGCAAALAALRNNLTVILTEETDWLGGQLTQQGVPPDEHAWIETPGATQLYRDFRTAVRDFYKQHYPLTNAAKSQSFLNPGEGAVSRLAHEPRVALAVLHQLLAPYLSSKRLTLLLEYKISGAEVIQDKVRALQAQDLRQGKNITLVAPYFVDATELGDLLPLTKTEFVTGTESRRETRELHALEKADPDNHQAFPMCLAMDYVPNANYVIDKPAEYNSWRNYQPTMNPSWSGRLLDLNYSDPKTLKPKALGFHPEGVTTGQMLNLWNYRRIIFKNNFVPGTYAGDSSILNWPQNDYFLGNLVGVGEAEFKKNVQRAKQLSLSLFYWLQTEAPPRMGDRAGLVYACAAIYWARRMV